MKKAFVVTVSIFALAAASLLLVGASKSNQVSMKVRGDQRCIKSNGTPNHAIGQFPNKGNPNSFKARKVSLCVDATPALTGRTVGGVPVSGVTLTGIIIRPGTADWFDASSPRGFSRDRSSGWNLEGMGSSEQLGIDANNAHVDNRGVYHYHGMPAALINVNGKSLMGYAADGFEIHYVGSKASSSYVLNSGKRSTAPYGRFDGSYVEDWTYAAGSGNLDECNGGMVNGAYVYFATDGYPFFPRCFKGTVSSDFKRP
ncbi:YHYH protein [Amylibacter sp.]|nr:YHYH protein [Amylibacter sp.]